MLDLRKTARFGYLPFMLIGIVGSAYAAVATGHSYLWLAPLLLLAYATAHAAEHILPCFEEWNEHGDEGTTTLIHNVVYEASNLSATAIIPLIVWMFPYQGIWPTGWPLLFQFLLAVLLADFAFTMLHFASHRFPTLWRLHAVHHGVGRLVGFNGLVRHPLHQCIDLFVGSAPLVIMGMPIEVAVLLGFAVSVQLILQHSNVAYASGPFGRHLSIGSAHHLHHVNWGQEGDCNFGLFTTWWDRILGTYQAEPSRPITANDMGIDEVPNFPTSYKEQLIFPFVYKPGQGAPQPTQDWNSHAESRRRREPMGQYWQTSNKFRPSEH